MESFQAAFQAQHADIHTDCQVARNACAGASDTVGTAGRWELSPNTVNSVPRDATLEIDVRDIDGPRRDTVLTAITEAADSIAGKRNVRHAVAAINQDAPATCGSEVSYSLAVASMRVTLRAAALQLAMKQC